MGKIKDYTVGTMKTSDLVTVSDGETGETKNLTVSQIQGSPFNYGIYTALLTQAGTAAPVATVLGENTIGTIVWTRAGVGQYVGTLAGAFDVSSTVITLGPSTGSPNTAQVAYVYDTDSVHVRTYYLNLPLNTSDEEDDLLYNTFVEVRTY